MEIAGVTNASALAHASSVSDEEAAELIQRSAESISALLRGDVSRYLAMITLRDNFTLIVSVRRAAHARFGSHEKTMAGDGAVLQELVSNAVRMTSS
jgi:hypothetical protein